MGFFQQIEFQIKVMNSSTLTKKLQIKAGSRFLLINPPENFSHALDPLPEGVILHFEANGIFDVVQLFVRNKAELKAEMSLLHAHLRSDTILWIAYPKKSSGIASDLEMMSSWEETSNYGLSPVASAAINNIWTALRFRPKDQIKPSGVSNADILKNSLGQYIDIKNRIVMLPSELRSELEHQPESITFFESLSYTNKKEYVTWVMCAKQEKTRRERIAKTVDKLLAGKKNPSEK